MATETVLPTAGPIIAPHLTPVVHIFSTPEIQSILARSALPSLSFLLSAFEAGVENVTVRSSSYEARLLPRMSVHFVDRVLPWDFEKTMVGGSTSHRMKDSAGQEQNTHMSPNAPVQRVPSTPMYQPSQAERDELFLDSLTTSISKKVDGWIAQTGREELLVKGKTPRKSRLQQDEKQEDSEFDEGWMGRSVESLTPWYAAMKDEVLKRREMVEWETFAWPVCCLLALSTSNPDPLNALSALWDTTSRERLFLPASFPLGTPVDDSMQEWADPNILRYIVLIHDFGAGGGREGWENAEKLHETIRKTYGVHTALLPIFSAAPSAESTQPRAHGVETLWANQSLLHSARLEPNSDLVGLGVSDAAEVGPSTPNNFPLSSTVGIDRGQEFSEEDLKSLRVFVREMVVQSIVPWIERSVIVGNEQYKASKRSIGGRLFSAGRKYFGGSNTSSRSGSPVSASGAQIGYNASKGYYPYLSQESQTRRLADLAFMIGDYKLAASVYEQASKDYQADRAWHYYSSACRMAGLSQLLSHPFGTPFTFNPDWWLEQATQSPSASQASISFDELRATMLYYDVYREVKDWRAAPVGLVRAAGFSDEMPSAMLLEQAALSQLHLPLPARRKYAFHMAMAAASYEKSGSKSLSRRCLSQAASLYSIESPSSDEIKCVAGWAAIRYHLHQGLGRQAYNVGKADDAVEHFLELMNNDEGQESQEDWLDDLTLAWEHLGTSAARVVEERKLRLHVNIFNPKDVHVRILPNGAIPALEAVSEEWAELEEAFLASSLNPFAKGTSLRPSTNLNEAPLKETFYLELLARNPLNSELLIGGLEVLTDAVSDVVEIEAPTTIKLGPRETQRIYVPVRGLKVSQLNFTEIRYRFNNMLPCAESLVGKSKILHSGDKKQVTTVSPGHHPLLKVVIKAPAPAVGFSLQALPNALFAGETVKTSLTLTNTGQVALTDLRAIPSHPSYSLFVHDATTGVYDRNTSASPLSVKTLPNGLISDNIYIIKGGIGTVEPGSAIEIPIILRGDAIGNTTLRWLFVYRSADHSSEIFTARASFDLHVLPSLDVHPSIQAGTAHGQVQYTMALQISNSSIPEDVVIEQVSSVSQNWICEKSSFSSRNHTDNTIGPNQRSNFLFSLKHAEHLVTEEPTVVHFSAQKIDELLQGKDVTKTSPGNIKLQLASMSMSEKGCLALEAVDLLSSILQTHSRLRRLSLLTQLPTIPQKLHRFLFPLFGDEALDLLIFWSIPSLNLAGHHHLSDFPVGPGTNRLKEVIATAGLKAGGLYAESQRERITLLTGLRRSELGAERNPLMISVDAPNVVHHAFFSGPCKVQVAYKIQNLSPAEPLDYKFWLQSSVSVDDQKPSPFSGALSRIGRLQPLEIAHASFTLWAARPGTYQIGDWKMEAKSFPSGAEWTRSGDTRSICLAESIGSLL